MPPAFPYVPSPTLAASPRAPAPGLLPGTAALQRVLVAAGYVSGGGYNPRLIRGSTKRWSKHAMGVALDVMFDVVRPNGHPAGNRLADALIGAHETIGTMQLIWAGRLWRVDRGWRRLRKSSNAYKLHWNHIHLELHPEWAARITEPEIRPGIVAAGTVTSDAAPAVAVPAFPFLRQGSSGAAVVELSLWLGPEPVDHFGASLARQVRDFQQAAGLVVDAKVGQKTWGALRERSVDVVGALWRAHGTPGESLSPTLLDDYARRSAAGTQTLANLVEHFGVMASEATKAPPPSPPDLQPVPSAPPSGVPVIVALDEGQTVTGRVTNDA